MFENFLEKRQENGPLGEKWQDRQSKRTRQKNKRGDRKWEFNDSPKIPGRGLGHQASPASLRSQRSRVMEFKWQCHKCIPDVKQQQQQQKIRYIIPSWTDISVVSFNGFADFVWSGRRPHIFSHTLSRDFMRRDRSSTAAFLRLCPPLVFDMIWCPWCGVCSTSGVWSPSHFRSLETQATCGGCFARQSTCSVISLD